MNFAQIRRHDVTNGPGVRTTLFVSGCTHNCPGCFNKEQQNFNYGELWTFEKHEEFIKYASEERVVGISILGGEPMQQLNEPYLIALLATIKLKLKKPIWLWTGYTFEECIKDWKKSLLLTFVDVLIDGRYEEDKRDYTLKYRGSSNQRVIDVQESLKQGKVIEIQV